MPRPRLQARIAEGLQGPLTLVVAPAGFGKTTLVAASIAACRMQPAWLSLDQSDNQAGAFLNYQIAASARYRCRVKQAGLILNPCLPHVAISETVVGWSMLKS